MHDMVKIKYWQQETIESWRWILTEKIPLKTANDIVKNRLLPRSYIVKDEEGFTEHGDVESC